MSSAKQLSLKGFVITMAFQQLGANLNGDAFIPFRQSTVVEPINTSKTRLLAGREPLSDNLPRHFIHTEPTLNISLALCVCHQQFVVVI